jgi:hypothetical protein
LIDVCLLELTKYKVENPAFLRFVSRLKPSYTPPTRWRIAHTLLDDDYAHTKSRIDHILAESAGQITLTSDAWTNQRSESLINYIATTRQHEIFIQTDAVGAKRHSGEMITRRLCTVIDELGSGGAVIAVATDNASSMVSSWPAMEQRYPSMLAIGCASYIVNLAVEEILRASTIPTLMGLTIEVV